jgi:hypothetical protein
MTEKEKKENEKRFPKKKNKKEEKQTGGKVMAGMKSKYGAKMGGTPMKSKYAAKAGGLVKKKNGGSTAKMIPGMARRNQARRP